MGCRTCVITRVALHRWEHALAHASAHACKLKAAIFSGFPSVDQRRVHHFWYMYFVGLARNFPMGQLSPPTELRVLPRVRRTRRADLGGTTVHLFFSIFPSCSFLLLACLLACSLACVLACWLPGACERSDVARGRCGSCFFSLMDGWNLSTSALKLVKQM